MGRGRGGGGRAGRGAGGGATLSARQARDIAESVNVNLDSMSYEYTGEGMVVNRDGTYSLELEIGRNTMNGRETTMQRRNRVIRYIRGAGYNVETQSAQRMRLEPGRPVEVITGRIGSPVSAGQRR